MVEHAHVDLLTGLPNRRGLRERLQAEWARIQRHGGQLSFIMADIDHFKEINDRYGHHVGDRLLQEVARAIAGQCRATDLPARYGGEEFGIIAVEAPAAGAACLAERCRREVAKTQINVEGEAVAVTASFGVADAAGASSPESLIQQADDALCRAKQSGRNAVEASPAEAVAQPQ